MDSDETIDYSYQAKTLLVGNEKQISESKNATNNLIDSLQKINFDSKNTILLSKKEHDELANNVLKYYEAWQYAESENKKLHKKVQEIVVNNQKLKHENESLKEKLLILNQKSVLEL